MKGKHPDQTAAITEEQLCFQCQEIADEAEAGMVRNDLRAAYRAIRDLGGNTQAQHSGSPINDSSGAPCKSDEDTMRRWAEHYKGALNHPPSQPCQELDDAASTTLPDADIADKAPSLDEVQRAIRRLKNGRAAGADDIPPELLKCAIDPVSGALHGLFCTVWKSGKVPAEWKEVSCCHYTRGKAPGLSAAVTDQSPFCQFQARYLHMSYSPDLTFRSIVNLNNPDSPVVAPHWMQSWHCVC